MANEIHHPSPTGISIGEDAIITPLSSWTLFWRPRYQRMPADLVNLPFFFWLAYTLRPRSVVTIGDRHGSTHFALCQAVDKLDLDARCLALGPWESGEGAIPAELAAYNDETYPEFSRLSPQPPLQAARRFAEGSLDLAVLSLEGAGDLCEGLEALETAWGPRLSPRGILVLTGVNAEVEDPDTPLARLRRRYPHFHLENGEGLLLLAVGAQPEERLQRLCAIQGGASGHVALTQIFARVGRGLQFEAAGRESAQRLAQLEQEREALARRLAAIEAGHGALKAAPTVAAPVAEAATGTVPAPAPGPEDPLAVLTEAFERQQIASDARLEALRRELDQLRRERDALQTLLAEHGLDATAVLSGLGRPGRENAGHLADRLREQLATLAALRAALVPSG